MTLCKLNIEKVFEEYSDKVSGKAQQNLTKEQKAGLRSLRRRINNTEIVRFPTDKSGQMSVDTPENYIWSMEPYLEGRVPSSVKEYEDTDMVVRTPEIRENLEKSGNEKLVWKSGKTWKSQGICPQKILLCRICI